MKQIFDRNLQKRNLWGLSVCMYMHLGMRRFGNVTLFFQKGNVIQNIKFENNFIKNVSKTHKMFLHGWIELTFLPVQEKITGSLSFITQQVTEV